jgi:hypothetical protein
MLKVVPALMLSVGCSLFTVTGPQSTPDRYLDCTTSRAVPIADLVIGSAAIAAGAAIAYRDRHEANNDTGVKTFAITLPLLAVGVAFLAASQYGTSRVTRCRAARDADRRWQQ